MAQKFPSHQSEESLFEADNMRDIPRSMDRSWETEETADGIFQPDDHVSPEASSRGQDQSYHQLQVNPSVPATAPATVPATAPATAPATVPASQPATLVLESYTSATARASQPAAPVMLSCTAAAAPATQARTSCSSCAAPATYIWINHPGSAMPQLLPLNYTYATNHGLPVGVLNGEFLYAFPPTGSAPVASPDLTKKKSKKRRRGEDDDGRPYVKKPLNAFMLFMREQRPTVVAEMRLKDSAAVNTVLGQQWKQLTREQQARYYEEARLEKQRHEELFPQWSSRENYGRKRMRKRNRAPATEVNDESVSVPEEVAAKRQRVTEADTEAAGSSRN